MLPPFELELPVRRFPRLRFLTGKDLDVAAKAACALEKFIAKRDLDGFAHYYEGEAGSVTRELVTSFIVGNSLLAAAGFPMCGEFDLKNCIAMMIFDRLEIGGSFAEFHPICASGRSPAPPIISLSALAIDGGRVVLIYYV